MVLRTLSFAWLKKSVNNSSQNSHHRKFYQIRKSTKSPVLTIALAMSLLTVTRGQVELGYRDLLYPDRLMYSSTPTFHQDPLQKVRSITTRAVITVEGRDQERFLTVFRASKHGHIEFGFPTAGNRPTGSLEIFDATGMSSLCCRPGIRMVAVRHVCSDSYMTLDAFGQVRACQLSDDGRVSPLRRHTHCLDGEKMHTCTESPYFYLDPLSRIISQSTDSNPGRYKLRFERKTPGIKVKKVYYVIVTSSTWEIKLRPQNSVLRRATVEAAQKLWKRSLHVLFQRTVTSYKMRRKKRNFRFLSSCNIDPTVVRDFLVDNVSSAQFSQAITAVWRSEPTAEALGASIAWSRMSASHKNVFVLIAGGVVKTFLRNSLMRVSSLKCLSKTQWGRLTPESRLQHLDASLTISWIQRRAEARNLVIEAMEKSLNSKLTTFVINEGN